MHCSHDSYRRDANELDLLTLGCHAAPRSEAALFDGFAWTRWTSEHWEVPIIASILYLIMIMFLKRYMASREKMRLQGLVIAWNFGLSLFSFAGLAVCVPHLLNNPHTGLLAKGWYPSVCGHSSSYGFGQPGFFVALFIY